tara:strand:- start:44408 stop:44812 length:405 start_codon:yes stop_codon:yes gene_type:complete
MPRVGKKHFSYDEEGYDKARAEADKTGKPMITGYAGGGSVEDLLDEGSRLVSNADRERIAREYDRDSKAANRDFTYDRASYIEDMTKGSGRKFSEGGSVYTKEKTVKQPKSAGGKSTMRGMGAATRGGKFSGVF